MALYNITNSNSALMAVEFIPVSQGNMTFFYIRDPEKKEEVRRQIEKLGQTVISEASADNTLTLITRGGKNKEELAGALKASDYNIELNTPKHKINWWSLRGNMSNVGQVLQLISAFKEPRPTPERPVRPKYSADQGAFAILNLAANMINILFGGQKEKDKYRLLHVKENLNALLGSALPEDATPPDTAISYSEITKETQPPPTLGQRANAFMRRNSVRLGEIGLRVLGSLALVFPAKPEHWKKVGNAFKKGGIGAAATASLNPDKFNLISGTTYLIGKTVAFASKTPDPYDPKPKSVLDRIREKYFFRASSLIEMSAAGTLAYGNLKKDKPLGALGGGIFMGGFVTRLLAPFGSKQLDTEEVFAYTHDFLARMPHEKLPQLVAESAALLNKDIGDERKLTFGNIYTRLTTDLYRYHNIALDDPAQGVVENAPSPAQATHNKPVKTVKTELREPQEFKNSSSQMLGTMQPGSMSFVDKIALSPDPAQTMQQSGNS